MLLLEWLVSLAPDNNRLDQVDAILSDITWTDELNQMGEIQDFMSSQSARDLISQYKEASQALPEEFQSFESCLLSGASMKDIFYTKIFPKALKSENSVGCFGYDNEEFSRIAYLRFSNTLNSFPSKIFCTNLEP